MYVKEAISTSSDETRLTTDYYHFVIKIFPGRIESSQERLLTSSSIQQFLRFFF